MKPFALLALAMLLLAIPAHAQRTLTIQARTAGDLAELCGANPREPQGDARINFCHGFAQGAVDVAMRAEKKPFCFPTPAPSRTTTLGEFVNWVKSTPAHRSESAIDGLFHFLAERFPCK
jgi:Rap1a immunity proteins